jgi:hypothetical protein
MNRVPAQLTVLNPQQAEHTALLSGVRFMDMQHKDP